METISHGAALVAELALRYGRELRRRPEYANGVVLQALAEAGKDYADMVDKRCPCGKVLTIEDELKCRHCEGMVPLPVGSR